MYISVVSDFQFRVEFRDDHIHVWQSGKLTLLGAKSLQGKVDRLQAAHGASLLFFDNRKTVAPSDEVRECMWAFIDETRRFRAIALVLAGTLTGIRANMTAASRSAKLRAFYDPNTALGWLQGFDSGLT